MKTVNLNDISAAFLQAFGSQNALLTAGDGERCNTMTIGWCQLGRIWNLPVCTVYVRPERYTYQFMEKQDAFSVCVLPEDAQKTMAYCGSKSGRMTDKIKECGLTVQYGTGGTPFFAESRLVLLCKKLYAQDMDSASVVGGQDAILPFYGKAGNWHRIYTGQVLECYLNE